MQFLFNEEQLLDGTIEIRDYHGGGIYYGVCSSVDILGNDGVLYKHVPIVDVRLCEGNDVPVNYKKYHARNNDDLDEKSKEKVMGRLHFLTGLVVGIENIRNIVEIMMESSDTREAKKKLCDCLGVDEIQAQAIIDSRLRLLQIDERKKIEQEYEELTELYRML